MDDNEAVEFLVSAGFTEDQAAALLVVIRLEDSRLVDRIVAQLNKSRK